MNNASSLQVTSPRMGRTIASCVALLMLTACTSGGVDASDTPSAQASPVAATGATAEEDADRFGGVLRVGVETDVSSLDPASGRMVSPTDLDVGMAIYGKLVSIDADNEPYPDLAAGLEASNDLRTWTLTLRPDVTFHDGTPLDAEAVVSHIQRIKDPATASSAAATVANIVSMETPDPLTVVFGLQEPEAAFPITLANNSVGMVPSPTAVEESGEDYARQPIGAGPFELEEYVPGDHISLVRSDTYFKKDGDGNRLPYLDGLEFRPIADAAQRYNTLDAGGIDLLQTADTSILGAAQSAGYEVQLDSGSSTTSMILNTTGPNTSDPDVRLALAYATDRDAIIETVYEGRRDPAYSLFSEDSSWYTDEGLNPPYDPDRARELLEGVGSPVELTITCITTAEARAVFQLVQQQWAAVGVTVNLDVIEQAQYIQQIYSKQGDYDVACLRNQQGADPDSAYSYFVTDGGNNLMFYSNPAVDEALSAGRVAADPAERKAAYDDFQRRTAADTPMIHIFYTLYAHIRGESVRDLPHSESNYLGSLKFDAIWLGA